MSPEKPNLTAEKMREILEQSIDVPEEFLSPIFLEFRRKYFEAKARRQRELWR